MSAIRARGPEKSTGDLPPPRERKAVLRSVSPPLAKMPFYRFIYYLAFATALYLLFYTWRIALWKIDSPLFGLGFGRKPASASSSSSSSLAAIPTPAATPGKGGASKVEDRIHELAEALGISSKDLAYAIADAVREHVPPASLSSIKAHQTGNVVKYLLDPEGAHAEETEATGATAVGATAVSAATKVAGIFEAAVGMDEPPSEML